MSLANYLGHGQVNSSEQQPTQEHDAGPLTDSPWFWAYLFATAALVALFLAGPKYRVRQPQLERQFSARQSGGQAVAGAQGPVAPSTSEQMIISLYPLYVVLALVLTVAWSGLWYHRYRIRRTRKRNRTV